MTQAIDLEARRRADGQFGEKTQGSPEIQPLIDHEAQGRAMSKLILAAEKALDRPKTFSATPGRTQIYPLSHFKAQEAFTAAVGYVGALGEPLNRSEEAARHVFTLERVRATEYEDITPPIQRMHQQMGAARAAGWVREARENGDLFSEEVINEMLARV